MNTVGSASLRRVAPRRAASPQGPPGQNRQLMQLHWTPGRPANARAATSPDESAVSCLLWSRACAILATKTTAKMENLLKSLSKRADL